MNSREDDGSADHHSSNSGDSDQQNLEAAQRVDIESRLDRLWEDRPHFSQALAAGQVLGNYRIRSPLGAGAFGLVYLADDIRNEQPVALKVPRPEVLLDRDQLNRFAVEATMIAKLDHPGVVKLLDSDVEANVPFIATQWCDGPCLAQWLAHRSSTGDGPPNWHDAAQLIGAVARAVDYVHQQGITHRDLKPANILLDRNRDDQPDAPLATEENASLSQFTPRISDFGLSKLTGTRLTDTRSSLIVGTPVYMAPEQLEGLQHAGDFEHQDWVASDIYSLGAILFEMLTGRPPIEGDSYYRVLRKIRTSKPPRIRKLASDVPASLERVCATCLQKNPAARYRCAADLADELDHCVEGKPVVGKKIGSFQKYLFWHRRCDWLSIAGWYTLSYCVLIGSWFTVTCVGFLYFDVVPLDKYLRMVPGAVTVLMASLIIPGVFGWLCMRGFFWAAWVGLIMNLPKVVSSFSGMLGMPLAFRDYYAQYSPYLSFTVHLFIFVCAFSQLLLYLFAIWQGKKQVIAG